MRVPACRSTRKQLPNGNERMTMKKMGNDLKQLLQPSMHHPSQDILLIKRAFVYLKLCLLELSSHVNTSELRCHFRRFHKRGTHKSFLPQGKQNWKLKVHLSFVS
jgi:hypothetical protein